METPAREHFGSGPRVVTAPHLSWLCFGAGAIGTYVGGSLALAGQRVVFLEKAEAVDVLRSRGLRLDLGLDHRRTRAEPYVLPAGTVEFVTSVEAAARAGPFDAAIFALKSFDTPAALEGIRPWVGDLPPFICFSNGVENESEIRRVVGQDRVIAGTVTSAVGRRNIGDIVLERLRGVGVYSGHPLSRSVAAAANSAGLRATLFPDANAMKWSKMLTNLIANPTAAILDMTANEVMRIPGIYFLEIAALRECLDVMHALSIPVVDLPGTPVRALAIAARMPAWLSEPVLARAAGGGRGAKMPSFHIDLHSGRGQSEVDFLHGAVARAGALAGVPTPANRFLTRTLLDLTFGRIPLDTYSHQPHKLVSDYHESLRVAPD